MQWRAREDYSRLRRSPFGLVQLALHDSAAARLSNNLFICREFELCRQIQKRLSVFGEPLCYGGPGKIRTPDLAVRSRTLYPTELRALDWLSWRRGRDSNPRRGYKPLTPLAGERLQPLGHLS